MPPALIKYSQHGYIDGKGSEKAADHSAEVLALLRLGTKLDFRVYRKKMVTRRIHRRMSLSQFDALPDYLHYLKEHPEEVKRLAKDLLISVTSFFRDPEAWSDLGSEVIAPLVRRKEPDSPLRVWSVGCATGEEAYSLGILILEQFAALQKSCPVQIFATDMDDDAVEVAREGKYPDSIAADLTPQRLARFFTRVSDSSYRVSKQLREMVTFARQNVITDAPFSKLDLVACRNLLIYLETEAQKKVLSLLHFALNDGGSLFLGPSETVGRHGGLFEPLSSKWRIYRRIGPTRLAEWHFPLMQAEPQQAKSQTAAHPEPPIRLAELAQNFLLRRFAVACVVINRSYEVLHFAGPTENYLVQPVGPPTQDLLSLARPGLGSKLRVVIQRAIRQNSPQSIKNVIMRHAGVARRVNIDVEPLNPAKQSQDLLLILFQEQPIPAGETLAAAKARTQTVESDLLRQIEQELEATREDLQSTIEELESSNEELKASNEEIMSMNEELQSTNEELETSKEELQSLNEELSTVNNQLHDKVEDLEAANNDLANLLNCTDLATIFLDRKLCIRRFTPEAIQLFSLIPEDIGRPLDHIVRKLDDPELFGDADHVLHDSRPREKEVRTKDGRWWFRRIVPYRTLDQRIEGVVVTISDTTQLKEADLRTLRERESRLAAIVNTAADAIITIDPKGRIDSINSATERMLGYAADEVVGLNVKMLMPPPYADEHDGYLADYLKTGVKKMIGAGREVLARRKDGSLVPVHLAVSDVEDQNLFTAILHDISDRKRLEREITEISMFEQQRLGGDLHDQCGQDLTALGLLASSLVESLAPQQSPQRDIARKIEEGVKRLLQSIRDLAQGLTRGRVEGSELATALAEMTSRLCKTSGVSCVFRGNGRISVADAIVATHLYHIAQEACTNALKYATAKNVEVQLREDDGLVILSIRDDGLGMPSEATDGLGIKIMRNRARVVDARLTFESPEQGGTVVTCILPKEHRLGPY